MGIITSIGGFLEVGSIATAAQGGAEFGYQLAWAVLLGVASLALLMEMTGRLSAVSKRTYVDLLRAHFGVRFFMAPLLVTLLVSFLVLASEIGGVSIALQMARNDPTLMAVFPLSARCSVTSGMPAAAAT